MPSIVPFIGGRLRYLEKSKIKMINLEITSRCNLLCLQCGRTKHGKLNPLLPLKDLDWSQSFEDLFTEEFSQQLDWLYFSGNYGDFTASKNADLFVDKFLSKGLKNLAVYTNGSARPKDWWSNLGTKIREKGLITFSVDGLKDTNHLYRVGSNWQNIERNMKAAIDSGVRCHWDFLVFEHNWHQVEEAKEFAKSIGIQSFNAKMTRRFLSWRDENKASLEPSNTDLFSASPRKEIKAIQEKFGSFDNYVRKTEIHCKTQLDAKSLMIDFEGRLWPCTWLGISKYLGEKDPQTKSILELFERYGEDFNDLHVHSFDEILNSDFYSEYLNSTWNEPKRRLYTCGRTCGEKFQYTSFPGYGNNQRVNLKEGNRNNEL